MAAAPFPGSIVGQIGTNNPIVTSGNIRLFAHSIPTDITVNKAPTFVLHWTHHFDGFDLKYVGGYSQYHYELHTAYFYNGDSPITSYQVPVWRPVSVPLRIGAIRLQFAGRCSPLTVNPTQQFSFTTQTDWSSHEIQIASTWNKPIQWIAGLYYFWETDNNPEDFQELSQPQIQSPVSFTGIAPAIAAQAAGRRSRPRPWPLPTPAATTCCWTTRIGSRAPVSIVRLTGSSILTSSSPLARGIPGTGRRPRRRPDTSTSASNILSPYTYGSLLPAIDISPLEIDPNPGKGICASRT